MGEIVGVKATFSASFRSIADPAIMPVRGVASCPSRSIMVCNEIAIPLIPLRRHV
jgi:hypothetical protein